MPTLTLGPSRLRRPIRIWDTNLHHTRWRSRTTDPDGQARDAKRWRSAPYAAQGRADPTARTCPWADDGRRVRQTDRRHRTRRHAFRRNRRRPYYPAIVVLNCSFGRRWVSTEPAADALRGANVLTSTAISSGSWLDSPESSFDCAGSRADWRVSARAVSDSAGSPFDCGESPAGCRASLAPLL